jgi:hypothetical protein
MSKIKVSIVNEATNPIQLSSLLLRAYDEVLQMERKIKM